MTNRWKIFPFLLLFTVIILFVACKKDDNSTNVNYRIIASNYFANDTLVSKSLYEYEGEKIKTIWRYGVGDQMDTSRTEVDYPASQIVVKTVYRNETGEWYESIRTEMDFQDDLVIQDISSNYVNGAWGPLVKMTYQYNKGELTEIIHYSYINGSWSMREKVGYVYDKGQMIIMRLNIYSNENWLPFWEEEYYYEEGNLTTCLGYEYQNEGYIMSVAYEFAYNGNQMTSMKLYDLIAGNWEIPWRIWNFTYDEFGNLQTHSLLEGDQAYKMEYLYEKGKGNVQQIFNNPVGQTYDIMPGPTK